MTSSLEGEGGGGEKMTRDDMMTQGGEGGAFAMIVTIQISFYSSLWWASAVTKSSLVRLERKEFRRLATTES